MQLKNISKSFSGKCVLQSVTMDVQSGCTCAITGASGTGKTTLVNIILGLMQPDSGTISGRPDSMACVFQEDRLFETFTARDNLLLAVPGLTHQSAYAHLQFLGLEADADRRVSAFSGGMKRRVTIARAVAANAKLIVLDEPFKGLDEDMRKTAARYILQNTSNAMRILITHDPDEMALMQVKTTYSIEKKNPDE